MDTSPDNLLSECKAAVQNAQSYLQAAEDMYSRYTGPSWQGITGDSYDPLNPAFKYLSLLLGRMVYSNPRVKAQAHGTEGDPTAGAMQRAGDRWIRQTHLRNLLQRLAVDFGFNVGIALVSPAPMPGQAEFEDPLYWPSATRIPQDLWFWDPNARSYETALYFGHLTSAIKSDLISHAKEHPEEGWYVDALEALADDSGVSELKRPEMPHNVPTRKEIVYYTVWVPGETLRQGDVGYIEGGEPDEFCGTIRTLAAAGPAHPKMGVEIREPRAFWGPRTGPYGAFGCYFVPNKAALLSPLTAANTQMLEASKQALGNSKAALQHKKIGITDGLTETQADAIKNAESGTVLVIPGFKKENWVEPELGGPSETSIALEQIMTDRVDGVLGMSEAKKGNTATGATATADAIADTASETRIAHQIQRFDDCAERLIQTACWYLFHDPRTAFRLEDGSLFLGGRGPEQWVQALGLAFKRGLVEEEEAGQLLAELIAVANQPGVRRPSWDELDIEIEAYSMERTSEGLQQRRLIEGGQVVIEALPLMPTTALFFDWATWLGKLGESLNWPDLGRLVDTNALQQMAVMQLVQQAQAAQEPQAGPSSGKPAQPGQSQQEAKPRPQLPGRSSGSSAGGKAKQKAS